MGATITYLHLSISIKHHVGEHVFHLATPSSKTNVFSLKNSFGKNVSLINHNNYIILVHFSQKKPDDTEIRIDDEIITKEETSYKDKLPRRNVTRRGNPVALVPTQSETSLDILKPSFVMDEPNKSQTWLYDTPGIVSGNQV